ncbi:carboxypeptidase-like regulatory domain-containing protein [Winogradskyella sp. 3972H.M.0a.05]|uniref:carboxypeptidase-like regulatory domain-containing protein n=1 Tax=Winogradskyella sp. 3972H.M.0a.05 TaxID=2950277 RepID=UPI0033926AD5
MKKIIIVLLLFVAGQSFAQIKMQGVVKDSIGTPLELANVIAINKETKALESFGVSNDEGKYILNLKKNTVYQLKVSYIGMKTIEEELSTKEADIARDFSMTLDNALDAVELTYEMPVSIKGDTLVYNADSFKDGTERKLEDVLKKLPGVEVNDDGEIEVEGKTVSKVMVEGKDFFDGDSKLATKNIPSNAVDKVQVLKNYSEVSQLGGVTNNQDNIALNIKLKEGKKNFWFGNIVAGGGDSQEDGLYLIQPKLFYYSPNYSINVIGDLNNIGEVAFTRRDYFNFSGGFRMPSRQSGTNINLGSNALGFLALQNNRAKEINTRFGAANFSWSPKKTLDISGFGIFSSNRNELQQNSSVTYTNPELGIPDEDTQSNTTQRSDLGMLKLSAKYKPNANNQLDYDVLARTSKESQDQNFNSSVIGDIKQLEDTSPYSINQNLNYYYTLNEKNIFALEAQHLLQDEDPFYNAILDNDPDSDEDSYDVTAQALGLEGAQLNYNIAQDKRVKSNQLDAKLDYWNVLNTKSNINLTLGTIYSRQDFNSNIFQYLDNGQVFETTPTINDGLDTNDTQYTFSDVYLGVHYRVKTGIFTFTPGFSTHAYSAKNSQFGQSFTDNFFRILPDFNMIMQLKKSEQINLNYRMQTQFTDVTNLARGLVLNNYNSIFSGDQQLESALSHNINLSYYSFNMFNYTNVFANINYNKNIDLIRTAGNFEPGSVVRVSTPFNSDFADESLTASGRFQRTFNKIRATLNGNFTYTKFNQINNDIRSVNENYSQTYRARLRTNFRYAPNVELGYRYTIQDNDQGATRTKFYTSAPSIEFDAYIWKSVTFRTDYAYNNFSDEDGTINSFDFWNASLSYRKNKDAKWEYEIKATNLLDTRSQNQSSAGNVSVSATEYFIQPRFITFRLRYEI